ncbi:MAG TPA: response regulator transcription factor [Acidimicrobiales bacterium]|nr:response regulator transcription factor [Acidimicrobiales bacterium]HLN42356.1 response regulator transcription factor [Acidimicrobiales bacterium]
MAGPGTTVLIVDDQMPFRMAARSVVGATPGFEVVGEAKSGEAAIEQVTALSPQLVLMDINMDGMSGIEATRRITDAHPGTKVILLSTYDADDLPADARTCGAVGYVHKEQFGPDVLVRVWEDDAGPAER